MATNKPRYSITLDEDMFQEVEDFRFKNRYQTRSEATKELIRLGLNALKKEQADKDKKKVETEDSDDILSMEDVADIKQARAEFSCGEFIKHEDINWN